MIAYASLFAAACLLSAPAAQADALWHDDFREQARYERQGAQGWQAREGRCDFRTGGGSARLVAPLPPLGECVIEAEMTPAKRTGELWTFAGLSLYLDPGNFWNLILVENANGTRYFELLEDLEGVHQAQRETAAVPTRLAGETWADLTAWEYGRRYRLALRLTADGIEGSVADAATGKAWRHAYSFAAARALKRGRPALLASGTAGVFHGFDVTGPAPAAGKVLALRPGKAGTVAILRDEGDRVAPRLARAFEDAGYGVTLVGWDEIGAAAIPYEGLDLLLLADARRVPVGARDALVDALCSGGRVMALGAPALSDLRARTPEGWSDRDGWVESFARRVKRTPLAVAPGAWKRSAQDPTQPGSLTPDPAGGLECVQIRTDLKGWDTWVAEVPGAFAAGRDLLVFEAKGDAQTPQMCIECTETDGSRWIGAVELGTGWRHYVLHPSDFPFWPDARSKGRGGSGDRLRPAEVARLALGVASSHTPKVKPGAHAFWVRGLSTAADDGSRLPSFGVPDVEALCPSYKLYPMDEVATLKAAPEQGIVPQDLKLAWTQPAYSPVWRERGRGFRRGRSWRWVPVLEAFDAKGRKRGALISLAIGDGVYPNALWANVAVADPTQALDGGLMPAILATARAMQRGAFLLEGGAELFSYRPGEPVQLGSKVVNVGRAPAALQVEIAVVDARGRTAFQERTAARVSPGRAAETTATWQPARFDPAGYTVRVDLREGRANTEGSPLLDTVTHRLDALRTGPARPEEFVRVEGSRFTLGGKPWYFQGINYRPSFVAGYPHLDLMRRDCYDPEVVEQDLARLQALGVNAISAVHALIPADPEAPHAYRDQLDFLERCLRRGMRCFFIVPNGRPYQGADVEKIKSYVERARLKDHPAVMCWELAWEPIEGPWKGMDFLLDDWNAWVVERYGSVENAVRDWGFDPPRREGGKLGIPTTEMCTGHGAWDVYVAAFRRAFSDLIGARYREVVQPLRAWDPRHLISFRGGACGIPESHRFAHAHSVGAAKQMDFLNPEGYNLQTRGWANPTPPEDLRRGGLVTHYYRFVSREKPVVWMEFGFTVNGFHEAWWPGRVRVPAEALRLQEEEYRSFFAMFLESGARGAAPWWSPGGFRLGENSDFGLFEPDGAERPAAQVVREGLAGFARVAHPAPDQIIALDLDRHYPDAWALYSEQYLALVKAGKTPGLCTAGTGTDSATCPLTAVGGVPYTGHNPPQFLNAEFNRLEVRAGAGPWQAIRGGETITAAAGERVLCRASVGNLGEAKWLASGPGRVFLAGRAEYGLGFGAPIAADAPYLGDAEVKEFVLLPAARGETVVSFEMTADGRAWFGERRTVRVRAGKDGTP